MFLCFTKRISAEPSGSDLGITLESDCSDKNRPARQGASIVVQYSDSKRRGANSTSTVWVPNRRGSYASSTKAARERPG